MNIGNLGTKEQFVQEVQSDGATALNPNSLASIWSTLSLIRQVSVSANQIFFVPAALSVVTSANGMVPEAETKFLEELITVAHATSEAAACSSVLAGRSSESDAFGDVGVLLPLIEGEDRIAKVLELLGLHYWLEGGGKMVRHDTTTNMPYGVSSFASADNLARIAHVFYQLEDPIEFRVDGGMSERIWVYIGKVKVGDEPYLAGLIGVGTWSDTT
ncbi:hypothetical protein M422DRAFT_29671 [Sphaerobolus stellatus SS14]|uniref:Uncharacterized protein n=1 Tax=Sphaerobolus stellatus (strain SS14) TaxID=990650 RepID=A0A0C9W376_SPHS4|nr:hypothetical protein M422DRAFT_29671 [Sphaerobolus stellatus SS14]